MAGTFGGKGKTIHSVLYTRGWDLSIQGDAFRPQERPQHISETHDSGGLEGVHQCYLQGIHRRRDHLFRHLGEASPSFTTHYHTCALEKCQFGKEQLPFLGHLVGQGVNAPLPEHLRKITEAEAPKNRKKLQHFLGVCNWIREYIPDFARISAPITNLLRKKTRWAWTSEAQTALESIQDVCKQPLQLSRPDPELPYTLQTDASAIGTGAVLCQTTSKGEKRVVSYASARFTPVESQYHSNEQEFLAVIWAIKKFRPLLEDRPCILKTDNQALTWLHRVKDSRSKLMRWSLLLQEFNFKAEHCPGRLNELPDGLSRQPVEQEHHLNLDDTDRLVPPEHSTVPGPFELNCIGERNIFEEVQLAQQNDLKTAQIAQAWNNSEGPVKLPKENEVLRKEYHVHGDALWKNLRQEGSKWVLVVPKEMVPRVLFEYHDAKLSGHPGMNETLRRVQKH